MFYDFFCQVRKVICSNFIVCHQVLFHLKTLNEPATIQCNLLYYSFREYCKLITYRVEPKPRQSRVTFYTQFQLVLLFSHHVSLPLQMLNKELNAEVVIHTHKPVCVELYKDYKDIGRFMLRYSGETTAAGVVTEVGLKP